MEGGLKKLQTHDVRDFTALCTFTVLLYCALSEVTSVLCQLLMCAHMSVCALRDEGTEVRCSVHCGVWCVTEQGRSHVCVRTASFFSRLGSCASQVGMRAVSHLAHP